MPNKSEIKRNPAPCGRCEIGTTYCLNPERCPKYIKWRKEYREVYSKNAKRSE